MPRLAGAMSPRPAPLVLPTIAPVADEYVDLSGIAAVLHVERVTVDTWRHRGRTGHPFPEPDKLEGRRPWWLWSTVAAWVARVSPESVA